MNIEYFREFVTTARCASFTRAARMMNISQPVLSKHIGAVEKEMGVKLFDRSSNPATLTSVGAAMLEDIQQLLVDYDAIVRKAHSLGLVTPMRVRIVTHQGCKHTDDLLRQVKTQLARTHPLLNVEASNVGPASPVSCLLEGTTDVAIVSDKNMPVQGIESHTLFEEPLCAVVRKGHPLAKRSGIDPAEIQGEILWGSLAAPVARHYLAIKDMLEDRGARIDFEEIPFHGSPNTLDLAFDKGIFVEGAGVIKHSISLLSLMEDYTLVPIKGNARLYNRVIWRSRESNVAVETLVEALTAAAAACDMSVYWQ